MRAFAAKAIFASSFLWTAIPPAGATNQGTLPDGAIPLTPAETAAQYVGRTEVYNGTDGSARKTWKAGGKALGVWEGKAEKSGWASLGEGTWTVSGNQFCYDMDWLRADNGQFARHETYCRQWWKDGKARWIKNVSGDDYKDQGNIYSSVYATPMSKGDQVSAKYAKMKAKLPHSRVPAHDPARHVDAAISYSKPRQSLKGCAPRLSCMEAGGERASAPFMAG